MKKKLVVLIGPPAAGKTTIAHHVLEREAAQGSTSAIVYVSSEMVLRTQIAAIIATQPPSVATLDGDQLILSSDYRAAMTTAAITGAISLARTLLAQPTVATILLEIPEFGFDQIAQLSRDWSEATIVVIHLDAEFGIRQKRNSARKAYARLPPEAMVFFEDHRTNDEFFHSDGSQFGYARISSDREIVETVDNVFRCIQTLMKRI